MNKKLRSLFILLLAISFFEFLYWHFYIQTESIFVENCIENKQIWKCYG